MFQSRRGDDQAAENLDSEEGMFLSSHQSPGDWVRFTRHRCEK